MCILLHEPAPHRGGILSATRRKLKLGASNGLVQLRACASVSLSAGTPSEERQPRSQAVRPQERRPIGSMPPPPDPPHFASAATPPALPPHSATGGAGCSPATVRASEISPKQCRISPARYLPVISAGVRTPSVVGQCLGNLPYRDRLAGADVQGKPVGLAALHRQQIRLHHVMHAHKIAQLLSILKNQRRAADSAAAKQRSPPPPCTDSRAPAACHKY